MDRKVEEATRHSREDPPIVENIPTELKKLRQWLNWRWGIRKGKLTKIPTNPANGKNAAVNGPETWSTLGDATAHYWADPSLAGIGFVFRESDPYCGVDMDGVVDLETKEIAAFAKQAIQDFRTYAEFSQSCRGIHLILKAELPKHKGKKKGAFELYDNARFFAFTGHLVPGTPGGIEQRQNELDKLLHELFPDTQSSVRTEEPANSAGSGGNKTKRGVSDIMKGKYGIEAEPDNKKVKCPFCGDKKFSVNREDTVGTCWGCGEHVTSRGGRVTKPPEFAATAQPYNSCTLQQYSDEKRLPIEFLSELGLEDFPYFQKSAVKVPYKGTDGEIGAVRYRMALTKSNNGDNRFRWKKDSKPILYGLWRLELVREQGYVVIVEGESDAQTLWLHDIPALGLPGASNWKDSWAEYLEDIPTIYIVIEPDSGGEKVLKWLAESEIRSRAALIEPGQHNDVSGLYLSDPDRFPETWRSAMGQALSWTEFAQARRERRRKQLFDQCEDIATSPRILNLFARKLTELGVVGEERNAKLLFLGIASRFLGKPLSFCVKGPSSGGKSFIVENVLKFFPPEAYYSLTSMSERALAYSREPLKHRIFVITEAAGIDKKFTQYLIRSLLSEGQIRYETVEKTPNGLEPRLIHREGPTGLILTTTWVSLHPENETRWISVTVIDTPEQTHAVMKAIAESNDNQVDMSKWHAFHRWLELSEHRVVIPFAKNLAELIPPVAVRMRRDFSKVLNLIETHAMIHQANRRRDEEGRIIASTKDYDAIRELVADLIAEGVESMVPETVRETVEAVKELTEDPDSREATVKAVAEELGLDKSAALRRVREAIRRGCLENLETHKGRPYRLVTADDLPGGPDLLPSARSLSAHSARSRMQMQAEDAHLSGPDGLHCTVEESDEGCRVARKTEVYKAPPRPHKVDRRK